MPYKERSWGGLPSSWEHKCFLNDIVTAASESLINTPGLGFIVLLSQLGRGMALAPFLYLATCRFEPRVKGMQAWKQCLNSAAYN